MNIRQTLISAVLVLGLATSTYAGELVSGGICPVCGLAPSPFIGCSVTNVGKKPLDVKVEIFDENGVLVGTPQTVSVPSLETRVVADLISTFTAICRFTFKGSRKKVRAHACKAETKGCISSLSKAE